MHGGTLFRKKNYDIILNRNVTYNVFYNPFPLNHEFHIFNVTDTAFLSCISDLQQIKLCHRLL